MSFLRTFSSWNQKAFASKLLYVRYFCPSGRRVTNNGVVMSGKIKANPIMVLCGPSGCGKSTLLKQLMADYPSLFGFSVSHTTRDPRKGEEDGKDYHFTVRKTMQASIDAGDFLEYAEYNMNLYGTSKKSVRDVMSAGKVCILDIDMQGVMNVKKTEFNINCVYIFVKPPSMEELERRLRGRKTETDESIQRRMDIAERELQYASEPGNYNYTLINDELEKAYDDLKDIINSDIISLA